MLPRLAPRYLGADCVMNYIRQSNPRDAGHLPRLGLTCSKRDFPPTSRQPVLWSAAFRRGKKKNRRKQRQHCKKISMVFELTKTDLVRSSEECPDPCSQFIQNAPNPKPRPSIIKYLSTRKPKNSKRTTNSSYLQRKDGPSSPITASSTSRWRSRCRGCARRRGRRAPRRGGRRWAPPRAAGARRRWASCSPRWPWRRCTS